MSNFGERSRGQAAHPLRRRVSRNELRMRSLERLELSNELIVLGVGDFRIVEHVVPVVVPSYFRPQFRDTPFGVRLHELASVPSASRNAWILMEVSGPPRSSCNAPSSRSVGIRASSASNVAPAIGRLMLANWPPLGESQVQTLGGV